MNEHTRALLSRVQSWLDTLPETVGFSMYRASWVTFVQLQMASDDAVMALAAELGMEDVSMRLLNDNTWVLRASSRPQWNVRIDIAGPVHSAARSGEHEPWS